jgi:hypothetical protein
MLRDTVPELILLELLSATCELTKALNIGQGLCLQTKDSNKINKRSNSLTSDPFKDAAYHKSTTSMVPVCTSTRTVMRTGAH